MIKCLDYVFANKANINLLFDKVKTNIAEMKQLGFEVEIQYQQSGNVVSVLLIGYKPKEDEQ